MGMPPDLPPVSNSAQALLGPRWHGIKRRVDAVARRQAGWSRFVYGAADPTTPTTSSTAERTWTRSIGSAFTSEPGVDFTVDVDRQGIFMWTFWCRASGCAQGQTWLEANDGFKVDTGTPFSDFAMWGSPDGVLMSGASGERWGHGRRGPVPQSGVMWSYPMLGPGTVTIKSTFACHASCLSSATFWDYNVFWALV